MVRQSSNFSRVSSEMMPRFVDVCRCARGGFPGLHLSSNDGSQRSQHSIDSSVVYTRGQYHFNLRFESEYVAYVGVYCYIFLLAQHTNTRQFAQVCADLHQLDGRQDGALGALR